MKLLAIEFIKSSSIMLDLESSQYLAEEHRMKSFIVICSTLVLTLQTTTAEGTNLPVTVSPVVITSNDSRNSCPQAEDRTAARQTLKNEVQQLLVGISLSIGGGSTDGILVSECGDGLWRRTAHLNMTDPNERCPSVWKEYTVPVRTCGRQTSSNSSCSSNTYSSTGRQYTKVCGRVLGYGHGYTNAFDGLTSSASPDTNYVEGLSITHGAQPRTHIWTYAAGNTDSNNHNGSCPCIGSGNGAAPPPAFVGDNYHCESGSRIPGGHGLAFITAVLWDGLWCEGMCCNRSPPPPWFSVSLPEPVSDDVEVRICGQGGTHTENTPIQLLEIYLQ